MNIQHYMQGRYTLCVSELWLWFSQICDTVQSYQYLNPEDGG